MQCEAAAGRIRLSFGVRPSMPSGIGQVSVVPERSGEAQDAAADRDGDGVRPI